MDHNPTITELVVEYQVEFRGGEYDGLKFHFMSPAPPYEWTLRDVKLRKPRIGETVCCYRQTGVFVNLRHEPDDDPVGVEWDSGFTPLPCEHIETLLPMPVKDLREIYPEILIWGDDGRGVVIVHAIYDLVHLTPTHENG